MIRVYSIRIYSNDCKRSRNTMFPEISDKSIMATLHIVLVRVKRVITRHIVDLLHVGFLLMILKHYFSSTNAIRDVTDHIEPRSCHQKPAPFRSMSCMTETSLLMTTKLLTWSVLIQHHLLTVRQTPSLQDDSS